MKPKSAMLLGGAMVCGLAASYIVAKMAGGQPGAIEMVTVPVAKARIPFGTRIGDEPGKQFEPLQVPAALVSTTAIREPEKLKGKIVTRTINPKQWLVSEDLSDNHGLEPRPGYVGMAIKVAPDTAAGGFVLPGSQVDVNASLRRVNRAGGQGGSEVRTILRNKTVLAIDQMHNRPDDKMAFNTINTVTLEVTPREAKILEWAINNSTNNGVRLLLRKQGDDKVSEDDDVVSGPGGIGGANEVGIPADDVNTIKVLVAKSDIAPGTKVEKCDELFTTIEMLTAPDSAYSEKDIPNIKDRTVQREILKGSPLMVRHFEGNGTAVASAAGSPVPVPNRPKIHVMFIQNGGRELKRVVYRDGIAVPDTETDEAAAAGDPQPPAADKAPAPVPAQADGAIEAKPANSES